MNDYSNGKLFAPSVVVDRQDRREPGTFGRSIERLSRNAWLGILIVEVGYIAWGAMAAAVPDRLLGPGGVPIMPAGYEGFSGGAWSELTRIAPMAAGYIDVLYRMYGVYNVVFGLMATAITITAFRRGERWAWWALLLGNTLALVSAMTYDKVVNAIGPFELTEYLGLAMVWGALAITAPFLAARRQARLTVGG